jgi:CRP/FNR family cyclic AMP-dependent transcriptional regulator
VAQKSESKFDLEAFLAKADGGLTVSKYAKGQVVFAQGDPADAVLYIREGRIKIKQSSHSSKREILSARVTAAAYFDRHGVGGLRNHPSG